MPDPLRHVRALAEEIGPRESAGPGEARAARYIAEGARAYTHQVWMEPFPSFASPALPYLPVMGLALFAVALLPFSRHLAAVCAVVAAVLYLGQSLSWIELGWLFRRFESRNVVAVVPSSSAIRRRLVLVAPLDSAVSLPRAPWWSGAGVVLLAVLTALAATTEEPVWAWSAVLPGLAAAGGLVALYGRRSAHDSPGAAAVVLAAGAALAQAPLRHTEVWTLFTGCREPGQVGLRFFLQGYGHMLADADFVVLDRIGDGRPAYTLAEGIFPVLACDDELTGALAGLGLAGVQVPGRASLLLDEGFRAVSLVTTGSGQATPRMLHEVVRILRQLGEAIDREAAVEAESESLGM